jgi:hypothetical protein
MIVVYYLIGLLVWMVIGCCVLSYIDTEDQRLFKWAKEGSVGLVVLFWPLVLYKFKR